MSDLEEIKAGRGRWPKGIDLNDKNTTTKEADDYINFKILEYQYYDFKDEELWELFKEDFSVFSAAAFKECSQACVHKLCALLRVHSVWVRKGRGIAVSECLEAVLKEDTPSDWTGEEIVEHIRKVGPFNSAVINHILAQGDVKTVGSTSKPEPEPDPADPSAQPDPRRTYTPPGEPQYQGEREQRGYQQFGYTEKEQKGGRELANLVKMYTDESRYSGEDDNFDYKLIIFHDLCDRADIPDNIKAKAYPTMLRGLALNHYYSNIKAAI
jgi:hypothetical protein